MANIKVRVVISGTVQGVGFRAAVRRQMERLNLTGWVENLPDGRVEAEFEGEAEQVGKMMRWCKVGPPLAQVRDVEVVNRELFC